jgi:glutamyl-tRNA synthetase
MRGAGRFAPTPTGRLHLGNVRTALLAWLWARASGIPNILRVEDLDPAAVPAGALEGIYTDLDWLGLVYDEEPRKGGPAGPYQQSARFDLYTAPLERLNAMGLLYPCGCSRKEVAQAGLAPHAGDEGPIYPGTCRPAAPAPLDSLSPIVLPNGRRAALRLNVPAALERLGTGPLVGFDDAVCGRVEMDAVALGDFVVRRTDSLAAYQLACAWDDVEMGCTQVLRGLDLLTSAVRQVLLLRLLSRPLPQYAHVGLVLTPTGDKLSKRDDAIAVEALRRGGEAPERILARLAGISALPETGDLARLTSAFAVAPAWRESVRLSP